MYVFPRRGTVEVVTFANRFNPLVDIGGDENAHGVFIVAQHIVGRAAHKDATALVGHFLYGITLELVKGVLRKIVLVEIALAHKWHPDVEKRFKKALPLIVLLEKLFTEATFLSGEIEQFLVVELATKFLGKHLRYDSASRAYLPTNVYNYIIIVIHFSDCLFGA